MPLCTLVEFSAVKSREDLLKAFRTHYHRMLTSKVSDGMPEKQALLREVMQLKKRCPSCWSSEARALLYIILQRYRPVSAPPSV